jgi:hypothetical protein
VVFPIIFDGIIWILQPNDFSGMRSKGNRMTKLNLPFLMFFLALPSLWMPVTACSAGAT